jgi:hypothetical protein
MEYSPRCVETKSRPVAVSVSLSANSDIFLADDAPVRERDASHGSTGDYEFHHFCPFLIQVGARHAAGAYPRCRCTISASDRFQIMDLAGWSGAVACW